MVDSSEEHGTGTSTRSTVELEILDEEKDTGKSQSTAREVMREDEKSVSSVAVAPLEEEVSTMKGSPAKADNGEGRLDKAVVARLDVGVEKVSKKSSMPRRDL